MRSDKRASDSTVGVLMENCLRFFAFFAHEAKPNDNANDDAGSR
jgi:hypothetical protein